MPDIVVLQSSGPGMATYLQNTAGEMLQKPQSMSSECSSGQPYEPVSELMAQFDAIVQ